MLTIVVAGMRQPRSVRQGPLQKMLVVGLTIGTAHSRCLSRGRLAAAAALAHRRQQAALNVQIPFLQSTERCFPPGSSRGAHRLAAWSGWA